MRLALQIATHWPSIATFKNAVFGLCVRQDCAWISMTSYIYKCCLVGNHLLQFLPMICVARIFILPLQVQFRYVSICGALPLQSWRLELDSWVLSCHEQVVIIVFIVTRTWHNIEFDKSANKAMFCRSGFCFASLEQDGMQFFSVQLVSNFCIPCLLIVFCTPSWVAISRTNSCQVYESCDFFVAVATCYVW